MRKVIVDNLPFLLSDTVGFIRKLPTELVESFKSTLDEVREADLLIHVVDISHPTFEEQIEVVNKTLAEIDDREKPMIMVFNKVDAFTFVPKEDDDLTPRTRENIDLDELKQTWILNEIMAQLPMWVISSLMAIGSGCNWEFGICFEINKRRRVLKWLLPNNHFDTLPFISCGKDYSSS